MDLPQAELLNALACLLQTGQYSDLTIICQSKRFPVHKALLCPRSQFFDGACNGSFQESSTGEIDLSEWEDVEIVEHMLHYFYHLDYLTDADERQPKPVTRNRPAMQHSKKLDLSMIEDPLVAMASANRMPSPIPTPLLPEPQLLPEPPELSESKRTQSPKPISRRTSLRHRHSRGRRDSRASGTSNRTHSPLTSCSTSEASSSSSVPALVDDEDDEEEEEEDDDSPPNDFLIHARLYALADKLGIPSLKEFSKSKFEMRVAHHWDDPGLPDAMEEVYENTIESDRGLRNVVVHAFRAHPELAWREEVREVVKACEPLAQDLWCVERGMPLPV